MHCSRNVCKTLTEFSVIVFDALLLMRVNNAYVTGYNLKQQIMTSIAFAQILDTVCDLKMSLMF